MAPISMDVDIEYLLTYLQDEFSSLDDVRIVPVAPSGTTRALDLPQDYDPSSSDVHSTRGVRVRIRSREFFFPASWVHGNVERIHRQAEEIRSRYE